MSSTPATWAPTMKYQQGRDRSQPQERTLLEQYADESIVTFWRAFKGKTANYNHDVDVATTVNISNAIDLIYTNPMAPSQVIWGITHPTDAHPGVQGIIGNQTLIDILLIRHFKNHGGLVLPPLSSARAVQDWYEKLAEKERAEGKTWMTGRTMVRYPNWRDARGAVVTGRGVAVAARGRGYGRGRGGMGGGY
ncbi:hypothetical protein PTNB85_04061 [Pyrenophora teres f. teres]|uniref:Uncharacterized protein n=1 Tax=Pyrenophora teres f. teres TaxID=97479 RepID=A0A6S6W0M7_9PLEO|nr:hypothetical protein HRS9139_05389 [Pyrenophora teres f. teres]KAE8840662.1 hypothetical protein PTNB85_04061 [Pyrenophora teres f. teres]KAE8849199.1 hypothetical protein HRS9122_03215 [Pyrenophora teres f. teres]CAE7032484.1 hypothetical protein PTTW11_05005 [Pyrenophora teres f. teres]